MRLRPWFLLLAATMVVTTCGSTRTSLPVEARVSPSPSGETVSPPGSGFVFPRASIPATLRTAATSPGLGQVGAVPAIIVEPAILPAQNAYVQVPWARLTAQRPLPKPYVRPGSVKAHATASCHESINGFGVSAGQALDYPVGSMDVLGDAKGDSVIIDTFADGAEAEVVGGGITEMAGESGAAFRDREETQSGQIDVEFDQALCQQPDQLVESPFYAAGTLTYVDPVNLGPLKVVGPSDGDLVHFEYEDSKGAGVHDLNIFTDTWQ